MNETVTFPQPPGLRCLTDNIVQPQHTTNEDTIPMRPAQENYKTSPPNTEDENPVKLAENIQTQDMQQNTSTRPHSIPITTNGDRLISTRTMRHTRPIPTQVLQMGPNNETPAIESVQIRDTDVQQPHETDQNHMGTKDPAIKAYPRPNQGMGKGNGLQHLPKAFLTPFKHGFHREIVEFPIGQRITHYPNRRE